MCVDRQTGSSPGHLQLRSVAAGFTGGDEAKTATVHVQLFTDPLSAWCWAAEPVWLHLAEAVGGMLSIEFRMMGVLQAPKTGGEAEAARAARISMQWEEAAHLSGMPFHSDIWFERPIRSSWPACAAFKAAEAQDSEKAARFLRRLREAAFCRGEDVASPGVLETHARQSGLDRDLLFQHLESGSAGAAFSADVALAAESGAISPPSSFFFGPAGVSGLRGPRPIEAILTAIEQVTGEPVPLCASPAAIEDRHGYVKALAAARGSLAAPEAAELFGLDRPAAADLLDRMSAGGSLRRERAGAGFLYLPVG